VTRYLRETLPGFQCACCLRAMRRGTDRVTVDASWRDGRERICPTCWRILLDAAREAILVQASLLQ
jgi:hypothetical protein